MRRVVVLLSLITVLAAAAGWLAEGPLLRFALDRAVAASAGRLIVEDVRGGLFEGVRIARIAWRDPPLPAASDAASPAPGASTAIEARDVRARLRAWSLLAGELDLDALSVASLDLALDGPGGPVALPDSFAPPLPVRLRSVRVDALRVARGDGVREALGAVTLVARHRPGQWRVERLVLAHPRAEATLEGSVGDAAPFAVEGVAVATLDAGGAPARLRVDGGLRGTLAALTLTLRAGATAGEAAPGEVALELRLRPFDGEPIEALDASLRQIDLSRWPWPAAWATRMPLPSTSISGTVAATRDAGRGFVARVTLEDAAAGSPSVHRSPLARAQGRLRWLPGSIEIDALALRVTPAGEISGQVFVDLARRVELAGVPMPSVRADLALDRIDLSTFAPRLPRSAITGRARIDGARVELDVNDRERSGLALVAMASFEARRVRLERAELRDQEAGVLRGSGVVELGSPPRVSLAGGFDRLDPWRMAGWLAVDGHAAGAARDRPVAAAGGAPAARSALDGRWSIEGAISPPMLDTRIDVAGGTLAGERARGVLEARLSTGRAGGVRLAIDAGATHLTAQGAIGADEDRLAFTLRSDGLDRVGRLAGVDGLAGSARIDGEVRGGFASPSLALRGEVARFAFGRWFSARSMSLSLELPKLPGGLDDRVVMTVDATDPVFGATPASRLRIDVDGSARAHALRASVAGEAVSGSLAGRGALAEGLRWRGTVDALDVTGRVDARSTAPVALEAGPDGVRVGAAVVEGTHGRVRVHHAAWLPGGRSALRVDATLSRLGRLSAAFARPGQPAPADEALDALTLELQADLAGESVERAAGRVSARLRGDAGAPGGGELALALDDGALSGRVDLLLPTLAFANRVIGPEWSVEGRLRFAGRIGGTVVRPRLDGELTGRDLALEQRAMGWRLRDGTLDGRFDGEHFRLDALRLRSAARDGGTVELRGGIRVADGEGRFTLDAQRLAIPIGPGQRLVVSGRAEAASVGGALTLAGRLRADEGRIELGGGDAPTLPEDVHVVRRSAVRTGAAPVAVSPPPSKLRPSVSADVVVELGDALRVYGSGVDGRLAGSLTLQGSLPQAPRAVGRVRIVDGRYAAYGRQLEIVQGDVVFNGPFDNPAIDIVALRRGQAVEAGVALSGTVLSPRVRLTSRPDVPDSEKLSWLVLGLPLEAARTSGQGAALGAAAASLLGRNDGGLAGGLSSALGLDVLTVRGASAAGDGLLQSGFGGGALPPVPGQIGTARSTTSSGTAGESVVAVGKRIGARLFVSYEQGLRGAWNLLRIQYDISRRLSLRAESGSQTALDLLYWFAFD